MAKKLCLTCMHKPARCLPSYQHVSSEPIFCSVSCAAEFGLEHAEEAREWCEKHQQWFETCYTVCDECDAEADEEAEKEATNDTSKRVHSGRKQPSPRIYRGPKGKQ